MKNFGETIAGRSGFAVLVVWLASIQPVVRRPGGTEGLEGRSTPRFYRAGQWRTEMNPGIEEYFWREHGQAMRLAGYQR